MTSLRSSYLRHLNRAASLILPFVLFLGCVPHLQGALANVTLDSPPGTNVGVYVNTSSVPFSFTISSDSAYTEKWYKENVEIVASTKYEMTPGTLRIRNLAFTDEGHYQLRVTNATGTTNSDIIWLRVLDLPPDPVITTHPASADLAYGSFLGLGVQLASPGPYSYRWHKDGTPIPNATRPTYTIDAVTKVDAGSYHVVVSTPFVSVTSNPAVITVADPTPPTISNTIANITVNHGDYAYFDIAVLGSPPFTFRLLRGDVLVTEQSSSSFYLTDLVATTHNGTYRVEVLSPHGTAVSNDFTITVAPPVLPAITLNSPATMDVQAGSYVSFNASVTGSNPMTVQWFKDGVPVKEGGTSYFSLSEVTPEYAGTYRLVATNAAGSATSSPIVLTVTPPTPPEITSYPYQTQVTAYVGNSTSLNYANITGTGPLTFQWYKDDVALGNSGGGSYSLYPVTMNDAGTYWLEVTSPYGSAVGEPITVNVVASSSGTKPLTAQHAGIVYVVAPASALLQRYDLATEAWLPAVSLGFVPGALAVNQHGVFVGNDRALQRFSLAIDGETNVRNFTNKVREILAGTNHLFVVSGDYVYPQIDTLDYSTYAIKGTTSNIYSIAQNLTLNADNTLLAGRDMGLSPSDIYRLVVNADGTFGTILSSPYHGTYAVGNKLYFLNNGTKLAENSGIIYASDTLVFDGGVGGAFADLVEPEPGRVIVARGRKAITYVNGLPGAQHEFAHATAFLIQESGNLFSFAESTTSATGYTAEKVALAAITELPPLLPVVAPSGRAFRPAAAEYLDDLLYLYDQTAGNVHVFDVSTFAYTDSLALRGRPNLLRIDPTTAAIFTAYADGSIWKLDPGTGMQETPFVVLAAAPRALTPAGDVLFVTDTSGYYGTNYSLDAASGARLATSDFFYQGTDYVWSATRSRLYFISVNMSPSDVNYITINSDGTFGTSGDSPYHGSNSFGPPLRLNPGHGLVLTGTGTLYDATTLTSGGSLGNGYVDAVWTSTAITSIREQTGTTQIQQWNPNTLTLTSDRTLPGKPVRIFARDAGGFVVLLLQDNVPVPVVLTDTLDIVATLAPLHADDVDDQADHLVTLGTNIVLDALPDGGAPSATFVWRRDGVALSGMTSRLLDLGSLSADEVGLYSVDISFLGSTVSSNAFWVGPEPQRSYLVNVSTRSYTEAGAKTLIMGFALGGSGNKPLLMRTSGPALANYGVTGVLTDPLLRVFSGSTETLTNDNWQDPTDYLTVGLRSLELGAFSFQNLSKDAALLASFQPGSYTIHADSSVAGSNGVALAEIYDAHTERERLAAPRILNFSGRTEVRTGDDVLILGFVIAGNTQKRLLLRGIGPTLGDYGVTGFLPDSMIAVYAGSTLMAENDNWGGTAELAQAFTDTGAFPLDPASLDAAIILTLDPGSYTAVVRGVNSATGIALAELYDLD